MSTDPPHAARDRRRRGRRCQRAPRTRRRAGTLKIGVLTDMSGPYKDLAGPGAVAALQHGAGGFGVVRQGLQRRGRLGRPPEQARCRRHHRAAVVRSRRRRPDRRGGEFRRGARGRRRRQGEEQGLHQLRRGDLGPDRAAVQRQHDPLGLRHLHAGEVDRRRDGEGGRRQLVLHHRRLRLRQGAAARHHRLRHRRRRQGASAAVAYPFPGTTDFSSYPAAGAGVRRQGAGHRQRRHRHDQHRSSRRNEFGITPACGSPGC